MIRHYVRHTLSLILAMLMLPYSGQAFFTAENVKVQITAEPLGGLIELRLRNKQRLRGARGEVKDSGFMLVDSRGESRQIRFDDIASVKRFRNSHTRRNVLVAVGIGLSVVTVLVVLGAVAFRNVHWRVS